ncbi:amino acid permease-domain-containing protein [Russula brevipes]|nr:amino acid permease-domain-containing protein [Russula brevipes]
MASSNDAQSTAGSFIDVAGASDGATSFYNAELDKVQRKLSGVHVQILLASSDGSFLGLGGLLATTGPLGVLLVFLLVGSVAFASIVSITEMAVFAPVSGSFSHYAARWVDPALGFATCAVTLPAEITAAAAMISLWDHNSDHVSIYVAVLIVAVYTVNIFGPRSAFRTEVVFATLKRKLLSSLRIGLLNVRNHWWLIINLGGGPDHTRHGFEYWRHPGPLVSSLEPGARGRFLGLLLGIVYAAFAMCGMEIITLAAAETRNPRKNMITAMRTVFFRIFVCYVRLTGLIVGMLVPSNDPDLFSLSWRFSRHRLLADPAQKIRQRGSITFRTCFNRAGVKTLPHIVNAVVLTSAFSSAKASPRFITTVSRDGVPYVAITISGLFSFFAFLNAKSSTGKVFSWFLNLNYGLKSQGIERHGVHGGYRSIFQPYAGMYVVFWSVFFILVSGLSVFWNFNASDFIAAYINLPIFGLLYVGWKVLKRTKIVSLSQLDFVTGIPSLEETEGTGILEQPTGIQKIRQFL